MRQPMAALHPTWRLEQPKCNSKEPKTERASCFWWVLVWAGSSSYQGYLDQLVEAASEKDNYADIGNSSAENEARIANEARMADNQKTWKRDNTYS